MKIRLLPVLALILVAPGVAASGEPSAEDELKAAFAAAAKERAATEIRKGQRTEFFGKATKRDFLAVWSLMRINGLYGKALSRAESMEAMVTKAREAKPERTGEYCKAALALLPKEAKSSKDPVETALACEFLGHFPMPSIELGTLPILGELLADDRVVFPAGVVDVSQRDPEQVWEKTEMTVGDVARSALLNIAGYEFHDRAVFETWWRENKGVEGKLWYWANRWRERRPEDDIEFLDKLPPETGLRVLMFVASVPAREHEGQYPWVREGKERTSWIPHANSNWQVKQPATATIAAYIKRHALRDLALDLLSGKKFWPELLSAEQGNRWEVDALVKAAEIFLEKSDVPKLEQIMAAGGPTVFFLDSQVRMVALASKLDPDRADEILLAQIRRVPHNPVLVALLLNKSGTKHWNLVKSCYLACIEKETARDDIIRALAKMGAPAKPFLGELLAVEDLATVKADRYGERGQRAMIFRYYVEAAKAINGGQPAIPEDLVSRACFSYETKDRPQDDEHNKGVPAARAAAVRKLTEFFGKPGPKPE